MIVLNYLIIVAVWIISRFPFMFIYLISDFTRFFVYHIFRYRRKVVRQNLENAFAEKTVNERKQIEKKFYKNLCDLMLEIIKIRGISKKQLLKRVLFINKELLDKYFDEGKSIIAITGHVGNWEWMGMALPFNTKHKVFALTKPVSNFFFDKYMYQLRTRFSGDGPIPFRQAFRVLIKHKNERTLTLLASDQTPTKGEIEYWTNFMNQETAVFLGTEKMAKSLNYVVMYFPICRTKRGFYEVEISTMLEESKNTKEFEITEKHVAFIETFIKQYPDNWLWSHRRWKHKKNS